MAVTGSEIAFPATPRATPCFIDRAEILAAARRDLQASQTWLPTTRSVAGKPDRPHFPSLDNIGGVSTTFRGWQWVAVTDTALPVSMLVPDFLRN